MTVPKLTNKQMSREHEDFIAVVFDGNRERASGASITAPGDVFVTEKRSDYGVPLLIECKVSESGTVSISHKGVIKIMEEASLRGARPMIALRLRDPYNGKHTDVILKFLHDELEDRSRFGRA
jgi:Holliday junction resolvase